MNIFEKAVELKRISIFKFISHDILLDIAEKTEEQSFKADEQILHKGEFGQTMFIIVSGLVKVHDGDRMIKELGKHDVFGELAALAPEKRIASITALEPTIVLKIDHENLVDLMNREPELSQGIISFLCRRMRSIAEEQT
jgi:CRP-like cAMP-binding protein